MSHDGVDLSGIRSNAAEILWPPVSTGTAAVLAAYLRQLDATQWLPPEEIAANQFRQLVRLARHATKHSKFFKARMARARLKPDDLTTLEALRSLPPFGRREIQTAREALFCDKVPDGHAPLAETKTSGSTGEPVVIRRTVVTQLDWLAMTMREHFWQQRNFAGRLASVRAHVSEYIEHDDWGHPVSLLFATGRSAGIPIITDVQRTFELLANFQPENFLVYPSILGGLTRLARVTGRTISGLKHIRSIGETLTPQIRADAAEVFGAHVSDAYSSQEVGYVALECPVSGLYHIMSENLIVEVLDDAGEPCAPGQIGRVVVTDLHNFATPIIRYAIGDYSEVGGACSCGRGLPTLARIAGRERNLILMPDGRRFWPLTGGRYMREFAPVSQLQLIQHDLERIEARIVVERPLTDSEEAQVIARIKKSLDHPFKIELVYFEGRLPTGPTGKLEEFICKVQPG